MVHEVIMPALGMAQDTGLLVAWRKAPGDAVAPGDALFEVETDKATMEVEAAVAGFLSDVSAEAGEAVPVGNVIARIVASAADVKAGAQTGLTAPAPPPSAPAAVPPPPAAATPQAPRPVSPPAPRPPAAETPPGRILASPKARRLAAERGLDLSRLAAAGHAQPFHVADLDRLPAASLARAVLTARAGAAALDALLAKAAAGTDTTRLYAAFAAGAWSMVLDAPAPPMTLQRPGQETAGTRPGEGPAVALLDLTATRLTGYVPQTGGTTLCVARDGGAIVLTLAFDESDLSFGEAAAWLDEIAARIEDPVRQLV